MLELIKKLDLIPKLKAGLKYFVTFGSMVLYFLLQRERRKSHKLGLEIAHEIDRDQIEATRAKLQAKQTEVANADADLKKLDKDLADSLARIPGRPKS